jgi:RibD C-terminal domain
MSSCLTTSPRTQTGPTAETRAGSSARESWPCRRVRGSTCGIVNANVADIYDELLAAAGERNLWIGGGGNVASQIADEGLLDEVLVTVVPVVLGVGSPVRPSTSRDAGVARLIAEDPELLQLVSAEGHPLRGRVPARSGLLALLRRRRAFRRRLGSWLAQLVRAAKDRGRGRSL